jgi:hypothetical protein
MIVNPCRPIYAADGMKVPEFPGITDKQRHQDCIRANVEPNELIIPLRHVKMVEKWLSDKGIYDLVKGKFTK